MLIFSDTEKEGIHLKDDFLEPKKKLGDNEVGIITKINPWNNIESVRPKFAGKMIFNYGKLRAPWVTASSTIDAIRRGERTGTTRYTSDGHLDYWSSAKPGDIIQFNGWNDDKVYVKVTKPLTKLTDNCEDHWCKVEGWSPEKYRTKVEPLIKLGQAYQMEYEYIGDSPIRSYFLDSEMDVFRKLLDESLSKIPKGSLIVLPEKGIGLSLPRSLYTYMMGTLYNYAV